MNDDDHDDASARPPSPDADHDAEPIRITQFPPGFESVATCERCDQTRPHTIRRLNVPKAPRLCDGCAGVVEEKQG